MNAIPLPILLLALILPGQSFAADEPQITVINPPELGFFSKQVTCKGIQIKAHTDVGDAAIIEAQRRIGRLLEHMPTVVENLVDVGAEMHIIGKH